MSINLFNAKKHGSVISLINALEKRQFNGRNLKNVAIQKAFYEGAWRGIKHIVEEFHEHPAITSEIYANGLINSWKYDKSKIAFPFLLAQADQGDLEKVKKDDKYKKIQNSVKPLMMPSQELNLQDLDMLALRKEKKVPGLPKRHSLEYKALNHWVKRTHWEASSLAIFLVNQEGEQGVKQQGVMD